MKRSPLKRKTKIRSGSTPMRAKKPGKPRRRAGACRDYLDWLKEQRCVITGGRNGEAFDTWGEASICRQMIWVDPAHLRTKRLGGDLWNAISLAHHLHEEWHQVGRHSWCRKYGQTWDGLLEIARQQTEKFLAEHPECRPPES